MASWIKMRCDLRDDPAVISIAGALAVEIDLVVGKLHRVWSWADVHTRDGVVRLPAASLDRIVECDGFAQAMADAGWLIDREGVLTFPDFERYQPVTAKQRQANAERQRQRRAQVTAQVDTPVAAEPAVVFDTTEGPWRMPEEDVVAYELAYPALPVRDTLRQIARWLHDNPKRRKVGATGTKRCITSWLNRNAQEKSKSQPRSSAELFSEDF